MSVYRVVFAQVQHHQFFINVTIANLSRARLAAIRCEPVRVIKRDGSGLRSGNSQLDLLDAFDSGGAPQDFSEQPAAQSLTAHIRFQINTPNSRLVALLQVGFTDQACGCDQLSANKSAYDKLVCRVGGDSCPENVRGEEPVFGRGGAEGLEFGLERLQTELRKCACIVSPKHPDF